MVGNTDGIMNFIPADTFTCGDEPGCKNGEKIRDGITDFGSRYQLRCADLTTFNIKYNLPNGKYTRWGKMLRKGNDTFDVVEQGIAAEVNLCGANAVWKAKGKTCWCFLTNGKCKLQFEVRSAVVASASFTSFAGTLDDFIDDVLPQFKLNLYKAAVKVVPTFVIEQIIISDVAISARRNRRRILEGKTVTVDYEVNTPEQDEPLTGAELEAAQAELEKAST